MPEEKPTEQGKQRGKNTTREVCELSPKKGVMRRRKGKKEKRGKGRRRKSRGNKEERRKMLPEKPLSKGKRKRRTRRRPLRKGQLKRRPASLKEALAKRAEEEKEKEAFAKRAEEEKEKEALAKRAEAEKEKEALAKRAEAEKEKEALAKRAEEQKEKEALASRSVGPRCGCEKNVVKREQQLALKAPCSVECCVTSLQSTCCTVAFGLPLSKRKLLV